MNARGLHEKETKTELLATQLIECNKLPAITGEKGEAALQRVCMFEFTMTFTDDASKIEEQPDKFKPIDLSLKSPKFKDDHYCAVFKYITERCEGLHRTSHRGRRS